MRATPFAVGVLLLLVVGGCSESGGPKAYRVSGEAKHGGQPIVFGDVLFTPDGAAGNSGPQGIATIRDGKYDTSAPGGQGFGGGPAVIKVTVLEKEGGRWIVDYEYKANLPKADGTHNIEVPANAKAPPKKVGPEI
jgi:hypothetical protein